MTTEHFEVSGDKFSLNTTQKKADSHPSMFRPQFLWRDITLHARAQASKLNTYNPTTKTESQNKHKQHHMLLCTKRRSNEGSAPTGSVCSKEAVIIQQSTGHSTGLEFLSFLWLSATTLITVLRPSNFLWNEYGGRTNLHNRTQITVKHSPALVESLKRTLKFHLHNPTYVQLTQ